MTKLTKDQIDNFHSGRMSESEMADFRNMLEADPAIKAESDFQSEIVNGLKEYRKLELKSRLDAINVGPTWIEFAQQSTLMKSFGGVIVASIIGTGIYFYGERPEISNSDAPATVQAIEMESIEFVWELGEEESQTANTLERPVELAAADQSNDVEPVASAQVEKEKSLAATEKEEAFTPFFEAPNVDAIEEDSEFATTGLDEIPTTKENSIDQPIDVQSEITKSSIIKYKYYDGKLFLNGNFNKAPYEILEINSSNGRRIYVYHLGSYYKVGMSDKLTELPKVTDTDVLSELKLLRENK